VRDERENDTAAEDGVSANGGNCEVRCPIWSAAQLTASLLVAG
jgi:hypothetical protein